MHAARPPQAAARAHPHGRIEQAAPDPGHHGRARPCAAGEGLARAGHDGRNNARALHRRWCRGVVRRQAGAPKPAGAADHANYSKRAMAAELVSLLRQPFALDDGLKNGETDALATLRAQAAGLQRTPRRAKAGRNVTQMHYARQGIVTDRKSVV